MVRARQEVNGFLVDLGVERRFAFESRQKLFHGARIEQRAGKAVLSGLARFFKHVDIFFAELGFGMARVVIVDQLRKPQRAGHARGPAADDDDIGGHFRMLDVGKRLAEDQHGGRPLAENFPMIRETARRRMAITMLAMGEFPGSTRYDRILNQADLGHECNGLIAPTIFHNVGVRTIMTVV